MNDFPAETSITARRAFIAKFAKTGRKGRKENQAVTLLCGSFLHVMAGCGTKSLYRKVRQERPQRAQRRTS